MNKKQVAVLLCRALAIIALIQAVKFVQVALFPLSATEQMPLNIRILTVAASIAPLLLSILLALVLWVFAESLANHMVMDDNEESDSKTGSADWQTIAFSVLGLFILTDAIPDLMGAILNSLFAKQERFYSHELYNRYVVQIAVDFLKFAIGAGLLFGAGGLAGLIKKVRAVGINTKDGNE